MFQGLKLHRKRGSKGDIIMREREKQMNKMLQSLLFPFRVFCFAWRLVFRRPPESVRKDGCNGTLAAVEFQ